MWDEWPPSTTSDATPRVLGAGGALAALVGDDPVLASIQDEVAEAASSCRDQLPAVAGPLADRLVDGATVTASLGEGVETDGEVAEWALEEVERAAFRRLEEVTEER